jgi:G:T-mismatch repair DNA endonuclease (very short patch repair protein)
MGNGQKKGFKHKEETKESIRRTMKKKYKEHPEEFENFKNNRRYTHTEEEKEQIRQRQKERWANENISDKTKDTFNKQRGIYRIGKMSSDETKRKSSESHKGLNDWMKGRKLTEEWKRNIGIGNIGKTKGYKRSEETIKKLKEARKTQVFPRKDTSIEIKLQNFLKQLGLEFYTHQYIKDIEHGYQCDILIPVQEGIYKKTIIECFGTYWHNYPLGREVDIKRCNELREQGFRVLVFWENEINVMELNNLQEVLM